MARGRVYTVRISEGSTASSGISVGAPSPSTGDTVLYDMRAGGAQDLQAGDITTIEEAESQCELNAIDVERCADPADGVWGISNDFLGDGTRAFVAPWIENAGTASCQGNGCPPDGSQQNLFLELSGNFFFSHVEAGETVYIQHNRRFGRTSSDTSPTSVGGVGVFQHTATRGRKMLIWKRPNAPERINWITRTTTDGRAFFMEVENDNWLNTGEGDGATELQPWWPDAHSPGGPFTFTFRITLESSSGAADGDVAYWVDGDKIAEHTGVGTYPSELGALELGGPTWVCPPQTQTEYFWDLVVWKEGS